VTLVWSFFVMSLMLLIGCSVEPPPLPSKIGTNVWPGYEPLYLARERGRLDEKEYQLIEYHSASEVIRAFRNGSLDMAALTMDEVLVLLQNNVSLKVVLVMDISAGGDVIMAKPGIQQFNDLKGKRIAVESSAVGAYVVTRALELNEMALDDVEIKNISPSAHEDAYKNGVVDAVVTFEPMRTRLLNAGAHEVFSSRQIPGEIVDVLVVRESYLAQQPERIKKLINTWFDTLDFMQQQRKEAMAVIAKRLLLEPAKAEALYYGLTLPSRVENQRLLGGPSSALAETIGKLESTMLKRKLLQRDVDVSQLLSAGML